MSAVDWVCKKISLESASEQLSAITISRQQVPPSKLDACANVTTCCYHYVLSCDTRSLDLCILFKFVVNFLYLSHSAPFFHFSYIFLDINFFLCYHAKYFSYSYDAVARNFIVIFNFSSQRPHSNYIFLSNVYSFDTMEFSMKRKY